MNFTMKHIITCILVLGSFLVKSQSAEEKQVLAMAEDFVTKMFKGEYQYLLDNYKISGENIDYLMMTDVRGKLKKAIAKGNGYRDETFPFSSLHYNRREIQRDGVEYILFTIYFEFDESSYSSIEIFNYGNGWFIAYANPNPHHTKNMNTREKLESIIAKNKSR